MMTALEYEKNKYNMRSFVLEDGRHYGYRTYGYFWSFCELNRSCKECDKIIRFGCAIKRKIEELQTKRILRICKSEPPKEGT